MLGNLPVNSFGFVYSNIGNPSTTPGASVTPGASNVEGTPWLQIASAANISTDIFGVMLWVCGGATTGAQKDHLLDIGVDNAGGSSYTAVVSNIMCGQSGPAVNGGIWFYLPLYIRSGSTVAVRIQGSNATAGTVRVAAWFYGNPSNPAGMLRGTYAETIGTVTNSAGVGFTCGNTGAEGNWQLVGTTVRDIWYVLPCIQISNGTTTSLMYHIDIAVGDASNKIIIAESIPICLPGTAEITTIPLLPTLTLFRDIPAGSNLYVRGSCSGTAVTGFTCLIIGIGG